MAPIDGPIGPTGDISAGLPRWVRVDAFRHAVRLTRRIAGRAKLVLVRLELTHRGAYAIRAVLTLAREDGGDVLPARTIAQRMEIPVRFLPQVLGDLSRAGIVEARLGRAGGYRLAKAPTEVSVLDIIEATEGDTRRQTCVLTGRRCGESVVTCDVHVVFWEAQVAILARLAETSVADVLVTPAMEAFVSAVDGLVEDAPPAVAAGP
jgi:Rrf2 family protein